VVSKYRCASHQWRWASTPRSLLRVVVRPSDARRSPGFANSRHWEVKALPTDVAGRTAHRQGKPMRHAKRPVFSSGPKSQTVRLSPFPRGRARRRWAAPDSSRGSDRTKIPTPMGRSYHKCEIRACRKSFLCIAVSHMGKSQYG